MEDEQNTQIYKGFVVNKRTGGERQNMNKGDTEKHSRREEEKWTEGGI